VRYAVGERRVIMVPRRVFVLLSTLSLIVLCTVAPNVDASSEGAGTTIENEFPRPLDEYDDTAITTTTAKLKKRIEIEPFNLAATLIFLLAITHTFLTSRFQAIAHKWELEYEDKKLRKEVPAHFVHHGAGLFHFLGEVEVVFGIWAIALLLAIVAFFDWSTAAHYVSESVDFTEAFFIIVIMTLASSRPIIKLSEGTMAVVAGRLGGTVTAWWFTILTLGPLLGSLITEPAAMTIAALLLIKKFYSLEPSAKLKYATIALLFVNTSIGGTLTNFAAPPVLMVAGPWDWGMLFMLANFGWKAVLGICMVNTAYYFLFRREFEALEEKFQAYRLEDEILASYFNRREMETEWDDAISQVTRELEIKEYFEDKVDAVTTRLRERLLPVYLEKTAARGIEPELAESLFDKRFNELKLLRLRRELPIVLSTSDRAAFKDPEWNGREDPVPVWVTLVHIGFMVWTIFNAHHPALFVPGLLFYLAFAQVTSPYQNTIDLRSPLLVGFFVGGLLIHGGVQGWWIEPVLGSLLEAPLMLAAALLTTFNDNAAITYLTTLIPGLTDGMKYAAVAGAVTGGGMTVIANAPNPAGQSLLKGYFENGVSPSSLALAALGPTVVVGLIFLLF
jgi:hypothetical protein